MAIDNLLDIALKDLKRRTKTDDFEIIKAADEKPPLGILIDNPLMEYILDRRTLSFGRFYYIWGKRGSMKTSLFYDLAKFFQKNNGEAIMMESENALDLNYAKKQGVDVDRLRVCHPRSLEEALDMGQSLISSLSKAGDNDEQPILVGLDSLAGCAPDCELEEGTQASDTSIGVHARAMSKWFRKVVPTLALEKCVFVILNQEKDKAAGMPSFGEAPPQLIGGNAPLFHSTYQFKMAYAGELNKENEAGIKRKIGSVHKITCKRNKLGRDGNTQTIAVDLYIDGGIDWWGSLVQELGRAYGDLVTRSGGYYYWAPENTKVAIKNPDGTTTEGIIKTDESYRLEELGKLIENSTDAKEMIRKAFTIPDLLPDSVIAAVEQDRQEKRKKKKTLE